MLQFFKRGFQHFLQSLHGFNAYLTSYFIQPRLHRTQTGGDLPHTGHPELVGRSGKGNLPSMFQQGMSAGTGSPSCDQLALTEQGQSPKLHQVDFVGKHGSIQGGEKLAL